MLNASSKRRMGLFVFGEREFLSVSRYKNLVLVCCEHNFYKIFISYINSYSLQSAVERLINGKICFKKHMDLDSQIFISYIILT